MEIWRNVEGTFGCYKVSNLGNYCSYRSGKGWKDLSQWITTGGYLCAELYVNNKRTTPKIHRLVALAFIANPNNYRVVNHINGIKTDNRVENLEWCTHSENNQHAWDTGLKAKKYGADNNLACLTWEQAEEIRQLRKQKVRVKKLMEMFNASESTICKIIGNKIYIKKVA